MVRRRNNGVGTTLALVVGVALALVAGAMLARVRPSRPPFATAVPTAAPPLVQTSASALATPTHLPTPTVPMPALPATSAADPPLASPTVHPTPTRGLSAWSVVGRWRDQQVFITEPFTVRGPWRICWTLPDTQRTFQLMVGDVAQGTWELLSAPAGTPAGAFDVARSGTFQLMFHNDTPYTAVVVERPLVNTAGEEAPPPCGTEPRSAASSPR